MGNTTSNGPITFKHHKNYANTHLRYGCCDMQGWRKTMEDAMITLPSFDRNNSLFGILDGHGGPVISKFVAFNFETVLTNLDSYKHRNYEQALKETFLKFDEYLYMKKVNGFLIQSAMKDSQQQHMRNNKQRTSDTTCSQSSSSGEIEKEKGRRISLQYEDNRLELDYSCLCFNRKDMENSNQFFIAKEMGTTANVLLMQGSTLYLANVGDSLSVMYKNGKTVKLNEEHKTTLASEYDRIAKSGRRIINKRIEGKLNLTRAIGDLQFKSSSNLNVYEQSVTAYPEITKVKNIDGIEFIVMGCDGLWDCVDPQLLCENISARIKEEPNAELSLILGEVFDKILSKTNNIPIGTDNMSSIIIQFIHKE